MKISLIIPTRSSIRFGIPALTIQSIKNQTIKPDEIIEVIGSGLTVQRNAGIEKSKGDIVIFIDDDIVLDKNYIEELCLPFKFLSSSAVTGKVIAPIYKTNFLYEFFARFFQITYRKDGRYLKSGFATNYSKRMFRMIQSEMLYGCGMAIKREVFKKVKFNEDIEGFMYGEDDWFANDLKANRFLIFYSPYAISYDTRSYPYGKQAWKIRCTIHNLIARVRAHRNRFSLLAFYWALTGFVIFKIAEAVVMKDKSIILGLIDCFRKKSKYQPKELGKVEKINVYKMSDL